ncbi:MAG: hypothetical protein HYW27_01505 [Candidatus Aenigmarchaeota archaeon]|nr:hypothetical protein [Candidatus Aenigmarchaeota archaeon]
MKKHRLQVELTERQMERLKEYCMGHGVSRAYVARRTLVYYFWLDKIQGDEREVRVEVDEGKKYVIQVF